jgi:hypothetical protein
LSADSASTRSTHRERIVEHIFVGQVLKALWCRNVLDVEVLRSEFDGFGYDLVLARGQTVRHIQFKTGNLVSGTTGRARKPVRVQVNMALSDKPSGCVIWIGLDAELNLGPFYWFGAGPGEPLPSLEGFRQPKKLRRTKDGHRAERRLHRIVPYRRFEKLTSLEEVITRLFGER